MRGCGRLGVTHVPSPYTLPTGDALCGTGTTPVAAAKLGRLPTPEDVTSIGRYDLQAFRELFPTWGKALKAAKLEAESIG